MEKATLLLDEFTVEQQLMLAAVREHPQLQQSMASRLREEAREVRAMQVQTQRPNQTCKVSGSLASSFTCKSTTADGVSGTHCCVALVLQMPLQVLAPAALSLCYPDATLLSVLASRTQPLSGWLDLPRRWRNLPERPLNVRNIRRALACAVSHVYIKLLSTVADTEFRLPGAASTAGEAEQALCVTRQQEPVLLQALLDQWGEQGHEQQAAQLVTFNQ